VSFNFYCSSCAVPSATVLGCMGGVGLAPGRIGRSFERENNGNGRIEKEGERVQVKHTCV
jgi:hypothetical protein